MAWTNIPAYVLDKVFGYQSANQLRENDIALAAVPYIVKSKTTPLSDFLSAAQPLDTLATGYVKSTTGTGVLSTVATIPAADITGTVGAAAHAASHQNGGADEISVVGLSGLLADGQTPLAHHASHETGGSDAIAALNASVITSGTMDPLRLPMRYEALTFIISHYDSPGSAIATGIAGFITVPCAFTITDITLLSIDAAVTSGSIVIDIWKDTFANFPPTVADSITGSAKPTLSSANKSFQTTLTGWNTALNVGDILCLNVDSVATVTRVLIQIRGYYY